MQKVLLAVGLVCTIQLSALAQTVSDAPRVVLPETPPAAGLRAMPAPAMEMPELVLPNQRGPNVEGPRPTPIGVDLTYADRADATLLASTQGPDGPRDTASVAWPSVATGQNTVLMASQSKFRVTDRCGNTLREEEIAPFIGSTNTISAPSVIYSPWAGRFAMLWLETNFTTQVSNYILVVTTSAGNFDTATWVYYRISASTGTGADLAFADAPRLGYGPRGLSLASDQFRFTGFSYSGTQTLTISNDVFSGVGVTYRTDFFASAENLLGIYPAKIQYSQPDLDVVFVCTRRAGGSDIWMWRIYNAYATRSGMPTTMPVGAYAMPPAVNQPEGRVFNRGVDCRLRSAVVTNDGGVKLHLAYNVARADPTQQAMIFSHRIDVPSAVVNETVFYVYGGNPEIAMFAPTVAMGYEGTRAIAFTFSSPTTPPRPVILISNPSLTTALQVPPVGPDGARHASAFGYGIGLDLDWNDYSSYGGTGAKRFVMLGQYGDADPLRTPTIFASHINDPATIVTYTGTSPLVFRKPAGATSFTPSFYDVTLGNTLETRMVVEMDSSTDRIASTPSTFTMERDPDVQVVRVRPSATASALPTGRWTDRLLARFCTQTNNRVNQPVIFLVGCIADVDDGSGTGRPDGGVTIEDLLYFLDIFGIGSIRADVDDGSGTGTPDNGVTIEDLLYFLERFEVGC